jgi:hypothetical protein
VSVNVARIEDLALLSRLGQSATFGTRSEGLHLSEIYKRLMIRIEPKKYGGPIDDSARRRMEVGILFENVLEQGLREKYATVRPGEIYLDGIAMSPDGVNPGLMVGEEYKATFKSCRRGIVDEDGQPLDAFLMWFIQMKGYAKALDILDWYLRVLFVCGDYNRPIEPQFHSYRIRFTQEEVDENWAMLLNVARQEGLMPC